MKSKLVRLSIIIVSILMITVETFADVSTANKNIYGSFWEIDKSSGKFSVIPELHRMGSDLYSSPLIVNDVIYFCYTPPGFDMGRVGTPEPKLAKIDKNNKRIILGNGENGIPNYIQIIGYFNSYIYYNEGESFFKIKPDGTKKQVVYKEAMTTNRGKLERIIPINITGDYFYYTVLRVTPISKKSAYETSDLCRINLKNNKFELACTNIRAFRVLEYNNTVYASTAYGICETTDNFETLNSFI